MTDSAVATPGAAGRQARHDHPPGNILAIGERVRVQGFGLAGMTVVAADDDAAVRAAWRELPDETELVILTASAHAALGAQELAREGAPLVVVMPA